ncbi:MAG TPA: serine/threonine-protein kinase [Gemmatimonadaceae bacterium]|nr:serine/threonine-protein kinase [Gemmatimonadaceae bacterium]
MAAVYAAFDPALERRVAVKVLLPEFAADADMAARFVREARTVAALRHPHVVSVYGARARGDVHAIVMQFVEGRSLDVVLGERGALPTAMTALVLAQVAAGLQHAHDRGVVHRDVKPANVLLDHEGFAVVSDFGIARRPGVAPITASGVVIGTLAYMSPEQRAGDQVSAAADQYAFGVMAFELFTGRLPFTGSLAEINSAHLWQAPPSPRSLRADLPPAVDALILRMLAKDPAARYPTFREAERLLRSLVPDERGTTVVMARFSNREKPPAIPVPLTKETLGRSGKVAAPPKRKAAVRSSPELGVLQRSPVLSALVVAAVLIAGTSLWRAMGKKVPQDVASEPLHETAGGPGTAFGDERHRGAALPATRKAPSKSAPAPLPAPGRSDSANGSNVPPSPGSAASAAAMKMTESPPAQREADSLVGREPMATPTLADARRIGREFVTLLNHRQWREVSQLLDIGGNASQRDELVRLTRGAAEFAAGFDRIPATPVATADGFETEFVVDVQWRGGRTTMPVRATAVLKDGAWHLAGFAVKP